MNRRRLCSATSAAIGPKRNTRMSPPTPMASISVIASTTVAGEPQRSACRGSLRAGGGGRALGLGMGLGHEDVAPYPGVGGVAGDGGLVEAGLPHGATIEVHAMARDLIALHVHEEGPPGPAHLDRGLLAGACADDRRMRLRVRTRAEPRELELPESAAMLV